MNTPARKLPLFAALAFFFSLTFGLFAEEAPEKSPPAPATPAADSTPAPTVDSTPAPAAAPAAADEPKAEKSELRRLDVPAGEKTEAAEDADADVDQDLTPAPAPEKPKDSAAPHKTKPGKRPHERRSHGNGAAPRISFLGDSTLEAGGVADAVVSIGGSSTASGHVMDVVISIAGSSTSDAEVGNAVVSVAGDTRVTGGSVGDAAIAVLGNNYVNGHVSNAVVAVLGDVELGPKADVGEVVCVGGSVKRDPAAIVHGQINQVGFMVPFVGSHFDGLHAWFRHCLLLGRPLAFGAHLMWAWWIALGLLALYVVLALAFPRGIERCAETFEQRPGYSILTAFIVTLLTPLAAILLLITIIGAPALLVFLFIAGLFGKAVMLAWIGRRITTRLGSGPLAAPAFAVLIGGLIVLLLYTIPFVGFLVAKLLSWLGLGVVVLTLIQGAKRNKTAARAAAMNAAKPPSVAPAVSPSVATASSVPPVVPPASAETSAFTAGVPFAAPMSSGESAAAPMAAPVPPATEIPPPAATVPPTTFVPPVIPVVSPAATLPRAGFWIRIAASLLDTVLVAIGVKFLPHIIQPNFMLALAAYSTVLWALKGTTVGGIVCGLKVVRLDDRPMDWATAIVRALGGFLSFFVAGLGFIWVAFDDHKQSWHDKIAGTTVVHVPKGTSLI